MSVESTTTKVVYQGNGQTTEWPVPFAYNQTEHLHLMIADANGAETDVTENFTVQITGSGDTSIIYPAAGTPLAAGNKLVIYRDTPQTQIVDLQYGGAFSPETLEKDGLDRLVMMVQEQQEEADRSVKVPRSSAQTPEELIRGLYDSRDMAVEARSGAEAARDAATASLAEAVEKAAQAGSAAERAEEAAERAESITGIGPATEDVLGLVKIGEGVSVDVDGKISVTPVQTASAEAAGIVQIGHGLSINTDGILRVSQWDAFPPYVPIPVWGVTLGGSDGRRAIMPGETQAREDWIVCDGGTDGKGGTMPNLSGRVMMGVNEDNPAGTLGGAASHEHTLSGQIGATTLTTAQMPSHGHGYTATANSNQIISPYGDSVKANRGTQGATTNASGGNQSHTHTINASIANSPNYQPFVALNFVMKVI